MKGEGRRGLGERKWRKEDNFGGSLTKIFLHFQLALTLYRKDKTTQKGKQREYGRKGMNMKREKKRNCEETFIKERKLSIDGIS